MKRILLFAALAIACLPMTAQQGDGLEKGFAADKAYDFSDIDAINTFNGNLTLQIPIGPSYPVNGGLSYSIGLTYNSKVWDYEGGNGQLRAVPNRRSNAGMGWMVSLGRLVPPNDPTNDVAQWVYEGPDGNEHIFFDKLHDADAATSISAPVTAVSYTRDGSYLRMLSRNDGTTDVEFRDGSVHTFDTITGMLLSMRDLTRTVSIPGRTANTVIFEQLPSTAGTPCGSGDTFAWRLTDSQNARSNYICFKSLATPESLYAGIVSRIVLAAPPTSGGTPRTATYLFNHTLTTVTRGCHSHVSQSATIANIPLLTSIDLPDGSTYTFTYNAGDTGIGTCDRGTLKSVKLPTGANIAYAYRYFSVPNDECSRLTFNSRIVGVASRTVSHPRLPTAIWTYTSSLSSTPGTVYCDTEGGPMATDPPAEEMIVTVTDPLGNVTENYYSVWPGVLGFSSPNGFIVQEYGQPFSRLHTSTFATGGSAQAYLSRRVFTASGYAASPKEPLRSTYVTAERDVMSCFSISHTCTNANSRVNREQTVDHDDTDRKAETMRTRFDGVGHYRTVTLGGTFAGVNTGETITGFNIRDSNVNPSSGNNFPDLSPGGGFTPPPAATPWILDTSSSTKTTEGSTTLVTQTCHDPSTGFLRATRTVSATALSGQTKDLVAVYGKDASGNLTSETYFGGDVKNNAPLSNLCSIADMATLPAADVRITHTYEWGVRKTSQYAGASFLHLNRTIDKATGMILSTTDTGGSTTLYSYFDHFGIQSIQPPEVAATTFQYFNSSGTTLSNFIPSRVVMQSTTTSLGQRRTEYQYDPLGRLWRTKTYMPDGTWSVRQTTYDAGGNVTATSEPATLPAGNEFAFTPPFATTSTGHDPFGRPASIQTADGKTTTFQYKGSSSKTRTNDIASASAEIATSVTETYDRRGRLIQVSAGERAGQPAASFTSYSYDPAGRLVKVEMPGPTGTQRRFFIYDYRGLLIAERHPEIGESGNGLVEYLEYDARGHAHRKSAEAADIRMTFDSAERITDITDIGTVPNRPLKLFAYDGLYAPCPDGRCNGKLSASARYNYPPDLGTVIVTESYQYNGRGGRHSRRDRVVSDSDLQSGGQSVFLGQAFLSTQTFDEFGDLSAVGYPCRGQAGACLSTDRQRTVTYSRWNGMLSAVPDYASAITYQPNGLILTVTHGEGSTAVLERWTADDWTMGRPKRIRALSAGGTELWSSGDYAYDGTGNISEIGPDHYAYDSLNRLTEKTVSVGTTGYNTVQRGYDVYGNYLYTLTRGCGDNGQCFDTGALPLAITGTTNRYADFTYDARGNVTADSLRTYSYDPLDMSTGLSMDGRNFRYIYTADDERIAAVERKLVSGTTRNITTWTLRGFDNLLLSVWTDDSTSGTRVFSWKEDEIFRDSSLLANVTPSGTRHYTLDHLGSPRLVTNANGQPLGTQNFDPFGGGGTSDGGALQFTGHERDAANLAGGAFGMPDYMHARYYDSGLGRFLSVDPLLGTPEQPQSWNRYSYVQNNPVNATDPTGMKMECVTKEDGSAECTVIPDETSPPAPPLPEPPPTIIAGFFPTADRWLTDNVMRPIDHGYARIGSLPAGVSAEECHAAGLCQTLSEAMDMFGPMVGGQGRMTGKLASQIGKAAVKNGGRAGSMGLRRLAQSLGFIIKEGGGHLRVETAGGQLVTVIPHTLHGTGTGMQIVKDLIRAAGL